MVEGRWVLFHLNPAVPLLILLFLLTKCNLSKCHSETGSGGMSAEKWPKVSVLYQISLWFYLCVYLLMKSHVDGRMGETVGSQLPYFEFL